MNIRKITKSLLCLALLMLHNLSPLKAFSPDEYVQFIAPAAKVCGDNGYFTGICIAQSYRETGFGKTILEQNMHHNVLGRKCRNEPCFLKMTPEDSNGVRGYYRLKFQSYESYEECFADYVWNMENNPAYVDRDLSSPKAFLQSVARHYATDQRYFSAVWSIYERHGLWIYDTK